MSDPSNTNRHTAGDISEFFMRLAEAIRQGKSDVQVLKKFIIACVMQKVFVPVFRNSDGQCTLEDRKTLIGKNDKPVEVPYNTKETKHGGWHEAAEVYFATREAYDSLKLEYADAIVEEADAEVNSIIKVAARLAAATLGLEKSKTLTPTSVKLDLDVTAVELAAKLVGFYVSDGDYNLIVETAELIIAEAHKAVEPAEAAQATA